MMHVLKEVLVFFLAAQSCQHDVISLRVQQPSIHVHNQKPGSWNGSGQ